jgi:hypothetical protein
LNNTNEQWVKIGPRGLYGGLLITGSIGSGKTQGTVLPYLSQLLAHSASEAPSMLALDPKGTYLKHAREIISTHGMSDRVLNLSLTGNVSLNPVYCERPLKDGRYISLAEMVRAASVNFLGRSSDSPFWEFSANSLIRNTIVYCAAVHGYFTLLEFYAALIRASDSDLASELESVIFEPRFDEEERFNIERAIQYFKFEYSTMEERLRTGILATSTVFINQLQEYRASKVFCPKESELTIRSMDDVVDSGKLLLVDIQQPGLARSMGTYIKLMFQRSVLDRSANPNRMANARPSIILIDEYQDVVTCGGGGTLGDESFGAKARESKPIIIVATQSLSSLMNAIGNQKAALELIQTFRTRIACHSSDLETINHYKELAGQEDRESQSKSISENSQKAKPNYLLGGFESHDANLSESISTSKRLEYVLTGKEFSALKTFEAYAQVFDGVETRNLKLYLKPYFLEKTNTKHEEVLKALYGGESEKNAPWTRCLSAVIPTRVRSAFLNGLRRIHKPLLAVGIIAGLLLPLGSSAAPNACSVAASPEFRECLELNIGACTCGYPPHPCALISYYVPQTFIEVHPEPGSSFFPSLPGTAAQLSSVGLKLPYGAEGDDDTQSFHAHAIAVPLASVLFEAMPSGGTRKEKMCFDGMSEHLGTSWTTGAADLKQPLFLAWSLSPKACLLKGAATSVTGENATLPSEGGPACSFPLKNVPFYPPSSHSACNGWGTFYPRTGVYTGPASMAGALMIASRIKSLSAEVFHSLPNSPDEKWQMILPQSSSCFREGQNIGLLETIKNARETKRLLSGKLKGYLFTIWKRTTACKESAEAVRAQAMASALPGMCKGLE